MPESFLIAWERVRRPSWSGRRTKLASFLGTLFRGSPCDLLLGGLPQQFVSRFGAAGCDVCAAGGNNPSNSRVPLIQVVLHFVGAHDTGDGNTVFLQNEVFAREVGSFCDGAKIDAGLGDGYAMNRAGRGFPQGMLL